jgi:hypothetical protein
MPRQPFSTRVAVVVGWLMAAVLGLRKRRDKPAWRRR